MDNDGFIALVNALKFNSCMETFAFGPNNVTVEGFQVFAEALRDHNLRLRSIILENNILCPESCKLLGGAIGDFFYRNYGHLQALSVSGAKLNDVTGVYFANPVYMNHTLQRLDLSITLLATVSPRLYLTALFPTACYWSSICLIIAFLIMGDQH